MKLILSVSLFLLGFLFNQSVSAAAYIKIGDIKGESKATGHEKWIDIESYQFSNGSLILVHSDGKRERVRSGSYRFKSGDVFTVKNGKAKKVSGRGSRNIIRAKTETTKTGIEHEDIGKRKKDKP